MNEQPTITELNAMTKAALWGHDGGEHAHRFPETWKRIKADVADAEARGQVVMLVDE